MSVAKLRSAQSLYGIQASSETLSAGDWVSGVSSGIESDVAKTGFAGRGADDSETQRVHFDLVISRAECGTAELGQP